MFEPLRDLFNSSKLLILDFDHIPSDIPAHENMQAFFEACRQQGVDPKLPQSRQRFNEQMIANSHVKYLVSRYGEDRHSMLAGSAIARQGRTFHLGIDIFCKDLETVYAPCDGEIVRVGQEPENHSFGYYLIFKPEDPAIPYILFAHLGASSTRVGTVKASDPIGHLGDFAHAENGGWSRHLHIQMLKDLPAENEALIGYSSAADLSKNQVLYPDPLAYFPDWTIQQPATRKDLESVLVA